MTSVFAMMLDELESSYLEVVKIPSQQGGYIRVAVSVNAEWYSWFCKKYTTSRRRYPKTRTIIRRKNVVSALRRLMRGDDRGVYAERLIAFAQDWYSHILEEVA